MLKILFAFLLFPLTLFGATWNLTGSGNWNVNANWTSPAVFPNASGATANFFNSITGNSIVTLGQNITIGTLQFDSAFNYTISGANTLTFQTASGNAALNITTVNGTGAPTISSTILLSSPLDLTNSSTSSLTLSGALTGSQNLNKSGTGAVILSGTTANTLSGTTTINAGAINLNKTSGVNAIAGPVNINSGGTLALLNSNQTSSISITLGGGTLNLGGFSTTAGSLTYSSGTYSSGGGTLTLNQTSALSMDSGTIIDGPLSISSATGNVTFVGATTEAAINGNVSLGTGSHNFTIARGTDPIDMDINGVISGTASITKLGAGNLRFSGTTANTFSSGSYLISAGELHLNKTAGVSALPQSATISGGSLVLDNSNQIVNTATITLNSGTFNLNGQDETISTLSFNGGTVAMGGGNFTLTSLLRMRNTTLNVNGTLTTASLAFDATNNGTATINGDVIITTGVAFSIANGTAATDMSINGSLQGTTISKGGAGRLELTGTTPNTFGTSGLSTVAAGELFLNKTAGVVAIPSGGVNITAGTVTLNASEQISDIAPVIVNGGTFNMAGFSETVGSFTYNSGVFTQGGGILTIAGALTLRNVTISGDIVMSTGGSITFSASNNGTGTISGNINLSGNTDTITVGNGTATTDMIISGVISNGAITKAGTGRLDLTGSSANTYTGTTSITAGELFLNKTSGNAIPSTTVSISGSGTLTLGNTNQINDSADLTLSAGTFDMGGFAETISSFTFNGGTFTQGGATLTLSSPTTALSMRNTTISGNLAITGGGSIVFDSTNNGTATISGNTDLGGSTIVYNIADGTATTDLQVSGVISNGAVTKSGAGLLEFNGGSANTYTGVTTVSAGTLLLNKTSGINAVAGDVTVSGGTLTLGAANQINDTSAMTLSSGTFDMGGFSETIDSLIFNGGTLTQGGGVLSLANGTTALTMRDTTISGAIAIIGGGSVIFDSTNNGTATLAGSTDLGGSTIGFNIADGTALTDMNVSGILSNGGIIKTGTGLLEFSGASPNTYTGLTTVTAGELLLNKTSGINAVGGDILINGGTVTLGAADEIPDTSTVTLSSGTFSMGGFSDTIGTFVFNGGTFLLGGPALTLANSGTALSMRNTTLPVNIDLIGGGAVVFDNTNNGTATISGNINLESFSVIFDIANGTNATDMLISGVISNGALTKEGAGTLELTGANTYAGGTVINAGTLLGNTTSLQGNITDNANLIFNQQVDGTYAGSISGAGNLFKTGPAALTLSNANSVGNTTVSGGTLVVNGTLGGGGSLTVDAGTILQGIGTITKDAVISGTLAPGNSIGTIHFVGNQILASGSTLEIELNPTTSDLVDITGTLTIQPNSTLMLIPEPGSYPDNFTYIIVHTTAGVTGTFTTVTSTLPLFSASVEYDGFNVLVVRGEFLPFSDLINTGNAGVVARTLDALAATPCENLTSITDSLRMITSISALENAFLQMQPSAFTALEVAQENDTLHIQDTVNGHLEKLFSCDVQEFEESSFWLSGLGSKITQETNGQEPGFSASSPGVFLGYDRFVDSETCIGGGLGYTHTNLNWQLNRGNAEIDTAYCALYGRMDLPSFYIAATLMGGINFYEISRPIVVPDVVNVTAESDHRGVEGSANIKSGLLWGWQKVNISPYISLDYIALQQDAFNEHGAQSLNLRLSTQNSSLLVSELGLDITSCFDYYSPFLSVGVMRESRLSGEHIRSTMQCGTAEMIVTGYCPSRTLGKISVGLNAQVDRSELNVSYEGKFASAYSDHALSVELVFRF